ncbi:MAG: Flp pilus assembly protein CpaB [Alphaproteobacteria bacterium]|nr:Flp pilus assembly protein CpaB [Alphaproteobacteria bacterium]
MASSGNNSRIALLFFAGAIVVAFGAIYAIFSILDGYRRKAIAVADRPVETVTVVAASRTLYQGVGITNDDLFVVNVPPDYLPIMKDPANPKQHIKAEVFSSRERVVGQVPRERILANEFVRPERLADGSVGLGLNALIPRGMRAISVGLKGADAVHGFLTPGNYVDVLVTMKDELGERRTETILQAVFVLGVNSRAQNENPDNIRVRGSQAPSVTFLTTPNQAEDIAYADELGALSLTLRNVQDVVYTQLDGITIDNLLARLQPKVAPIPSLDDTKPAVRVYSPRPVTQEDLYGSIKVYKGTSQSEVNYKITGNE